MNNIYKEDKSLSEVRSWKELCRQETEHLSFEEYSKKLKAVAEKLMNKFNLKLRTVYR